MTFRVNFRERPIRRGVEVFFKVRIKTQRVKPVFENSRPPEFFFRGLDRRHGCHLHHLNRSDIALRALRAFDFTLIDIRRRATTCLVNDRASRQGMMGWCETAIILKGSEKGIDKLFSEKP